MPEWRQALDDFLDSIADELIAIRRHLHQNPEPSREEFETTRYLTAQLQDAEIRPQVVLDGRGILAGPALAPDGRAVALRADMDALRIQDLKTVGYRSTRDGLMHACGHDAHATILLGAARALQSCGRLLPWPVPWRAVFQPAEEVGEGAAEMVAAGAMDGVRTVVALHVAPELPVGRVGVRAGVMTALCQEVVVTIRGVGGHAARPHLTSDPIAATAQLINSVYQFMPRSIDSRDPVVVSFGSIAGGGNSNVIPDRVKLSGTIRTLGRTTAARVRERLGQIARGVGETSGCPIDLAFGREVNAVVNDDEVTRECAAAAGEVVGTDQVEVVPLPSMGSEDFSAYLDRVPGCLFRLGVARSAPWPALHSPEFDVDERALVLGAKILARTAVQLSRP